jgi:hypothetical protein
VIECPEEVGHVSSSGSTRAPASAAATAAAASLPATAAGRRTIREPTPKIKLGKTEREVPTISASYFGLEVDCSEEDRLITTPHSSCTDLVKVSDKRISVNTSARRAQIPTNTFVEQTPFPLGHRKTNVWWLCFSAYNMKLEANRTNKLHSAQCCNFCGSGVSLGVKASAGLLEKHIMRHHKPAYELLVSEHGFLSTIHGGNMASTAAVPSEVLPVATVSGVPSGVMVKWDSEETTATHSTLYSDAPYSFSVVKADRKEPFIKTFGTLIHCNAGILTIGETRYRIQAQQPNGKLRCCFCICFEYGNDSGSCSSLCCSTQWNVTVLYSN